jgi:hypothetical protein
MIRVRPRIFEGLDWRELSPAEGRRRWRFEANRFAVTLDLPLTETISFHDRDGREWARFTGPVFSISRQYWFNGNSPKVWLPCFGWVGTPDVRGDVSGAGGNIFAAGIHDAMGQFRDTQHFPLSRREIDVCFYDLNRLSGFPLALPYYSAVRAASGFWPHADGGEYSVLHTP